MPYLHPPPALSLLGVRLPVFGLFVFAALALTYVLIVLRGRRLSPGVVRPSVGSRRVHRPGDGDPRLVELPSGRERIEALRELRRDAESAEPDGE